MKKSFLSTIVVTFALAVIMMPGIGLATVDVQGTAYMTWDAVAFANSVNWIDPAAGDMRGSFSAANVTLNGANVNDSDSIDAAPWGTTGFSTTLTNTAGSISGQGYTTGAGIQESISSITLTGPATASVDLAQGVLSGQFTVSQVTPLDILADFNLLMSLFSDTIHNFLSFVSVSVGFTLSDFNQTDDTTGQSLVLASDSRDFSMSLIGTGSDSFSLDFTNNVQSPGSYVPLHLTYSLQPNVTYDFEAQVSTVASATVPEPMSIFLLLSGIAGLAIFKKQFV
jgi:hypothetical protein